MVVMGFSFAIWVEGLDFGLRFPAKTRLAGYFTVKSIQFARQKGFEGLSRTLGRLRPSMHLVLPHSHKLFRASGMDGYGIIEVGFGGAHFDGYCEALDHFIDAVADAVETNDLLVLSCADQFHFD